MPALNWAAGMAFTLCYVMWAVALVTGSELPAGSGSLHNQGARSVAAGL